MLTNAASPLLPARWRLLFNQVFGRRSPNRPAVTQPGLHQPTTWLSIRNNFTHPANHEDFFTTAALNYISAVAVFLEAGKVSGRPACTLAHVAAAVSLVEHGAVLRAIAGEPTAAHLAQPLLSALAEGAQQQVAGVIAEAQTLVTPLLSPADSATHQRVLSYFQSIA